MGVRVVEGMYECMGVWVYEGKHENVPKTATSPDPKAASSDHPSPSNATEVAWG